MARSVSRSGRETEARGPPGHCGGPDGQGEDSLFAQAPRDANRGASVPDETRDDHPMTEGPDAETVESRPQLRRSRQSSRTELRFANRALEVPTSPLGDHGTHP